MKLKALSAALLLTAGSGAAEAALSIGLGAPSSFVLAVIDQSNQATYLKDLGLNYADLVNGAVSAPISWDLSTDANFAGFAGHELAYNITGGYAVDDANLSNFDKTGQWSNFFTDTAQWGLVTSGKAGAPGLQTGYNELVASTGGVANGQGFINGWIGIVDLTLNGANSISKQAVNNLSFYDANFEQGSLAAGITVSTVLNSDAPHLFWLSNTIGFGSDPGILKDLGTLALNGSTLTFTPTAVPVPAAVWLLGSALLGMVSVGRRENKA